LGCRNIGALFIDELSTKKNRARVPVTGTQTLEQPSPRTAHAVKVLPLCTLSKKT
jgi:hypothetical protein